MHNFVTQLNHDVSRMAHAQRFHVSRKEAVNFLEAYRKECGDHAATKTKLADLHKEHSMVMQQIAALKNTLEIEKTKNAAIQSA